MNRESRIVNRNHPLYSILYPLVILLLAIPALPAQYAARGRISASATPNTFARFNDDNFLDSAIEGIHFYDIEGYPCLGCTPVGVGGDENFSPYVTFQPYRAEWLVGEMKDGQMALAVKPPVDLVAIVDVTLGGVQTIDDVAGTAEVTVVLCTNQTIEIENGPWIMKTGNWARPVWYPEGGITQAFQGVVVSVLAGKTYAGTQWYITTAGLIMIGNNSTTWAQSKLSVNPDTVTSFPVEFGVALSDETTVITTGTAKVTFRAPCAFTLTAVRANVNTVSSSGAPQVDINDGGTTVLSTKLTIDANEKSSITAATAAVISDAVIADDAEITMDIDVAGTGAKGLKVWMIGFKN